uniref:Uncharacterized protein n=1 Tax=Glossina brevipalpis TaxID=37001 RepID=A0A1A9WFY3_9MUSC
MFTVIKFCAYFIVLLCVATYWIFEKKCHSQIIAITQFTETMVFNWISVGSEDNSNEKSVNSSPLKRTIVLNRWPRFKDLLHMQGQELNVKNQKKRLLYLRTHRIKCEKPEKAFIIFEDTYFVVLDEAVRMLNMGFKDSVATIMNHLTMRSITFPMKMQHISSDLFIQFIARVCTELSTSMGIGFGVNGLGGGLLGTDDDV